MAKSSKSNFLVPLIAAALALLYFTLSNWNGSSNQPQNSDSQATKGNSNISSNPVDGQRAGSDKTESMDSPSPLPEDLTNAIKNPEPELPEDLKKQLESPPPELPDDLKRQLEGPPPELPEDLKAQLNSPPPELPEDIKKALATPPRAVTLEEVNGGAAPTE